jgi:hypothetical protein
VDDFFTVQSHNAKELKHFFPELEELSHLSKNVIVDGEVFFIVVRVKKGGSDFLFGVFMVFS